MLPAIESALRDRRFESARRLCLHSLKLDSSPADRYAVWTHLHEAARWLGDFPAATTAWQAMVELQPEQRFRHALLRASDYHYFSAYGFYRNSAAEKSGITGDEYADQMNALAWEQAQLAAASIRTAQERHHLISILEGVAKESEVVLPLLRQLRAETGQDQELHAPRGDEAKGAGTGTLSGCLQYQDGSPVSGARVTLGLQVEVVEGDPATYLAAEMHSIPEIGEQRALYATTAADGSYSIAGVPEGRHEFLAVTLDGNSHDIVTRFLHHNIPVEQGQSLVLNGTVADWVSAAPRVVPQPFPENLLRDGVSYRLVRLETWKNPFYFHFPRQLVRWDLPEETGQRAEGLLLLSSTAPEEAQPFQLTGSSFSFFADLPQLTDTVWALYSREGGQSASANTVSTAIAVRPDAAQGEAVLDTGRASFRVAWAGEDLGACRSVVPLVSVLGEDGIWRGAGRFTSLVSGGADIVDRGFEILEEGPLVMRWASTYSLASGARVVFEMEAHAGEAYLLVREVWEQLPKSPEETGLGFEFSLREFGGGHGRGFLHWNPEHGSIHWTSLKAEEAELARLQESVPWWIPPCGFGYAMTRDGLESRDYIGVFTLRRGEWIDREFQRLCRGPIDPDGSENRELDWPFPEMIGSTISMITAGTREDGDAYFRFGAFDGERRWGILTSSLERNDGQHKEISLVQHKNSSPRLQDFKDWHLDEADAAPRPHVVASRDSLKKLRARRDSPAFAPHWEKIRAGHVPGPTLGLAFAVEGDPLVGWRKKRELVGLAHIRAKMTLLGRDYSDMYSPVGARPITQWAEDYDLIAASGVFTVEEERLVRGFLLLMGYLYLSPDLMNWRHGSRNANFEADRVDVVAAIGLCFHGQPGMHSLIEHTVELMESSLNAYCTPGSGKWYENPACYYLQASKCRTNLCYHLWSHGIYDSSLLPRFKDFLRWGILLLTPNMPRSNNFLRDGGTWEEYAQQDLSRRIPPIGDHADLGRFVPEHYAVMSRLYRERDPDFADELMWAYQQGGSDGMGFSNLPLFFAAMEEEELVPRTSTPLASRRLEGFGAVIRENVGQEDEFYLLTKQGPGGYRYHRTEGSFVLFAAGRPLVYDGGEAGEAWRHSTLSFFDVHTPMAPGHIARFARLPGLGYSRSVHPKAIRPGEPTFLSDKCDHPLVLEAWKRFQEQSPEIGRTFVTLGHSMVLIHDLLHLDAAIPHHWHLQAVGHHPGEGVGKVSHAGGPLSFPISGRYGKDFQVDLFGVGPAEVSVHQLPILEYAHHKDTAGSFSTCHIQVSPETDQQGAVRSQTAVLQVGPVPGQIQVLHEDPAGSRLLLLQEKEAVHQVYLGGQDTAFHFQSLKVQGRCAVVSRRPDGVELNLVEGTYLEFEGQGLRSTGPAVRLLAGPQGREVTVTGTGEVEVLDASGWHTLQATPQQQRFMLGAVPLES